MSIDRYHDGDSGDGPSMLVRIKSKKLSRCSSTDWTGPISALRRLEMGASGFDGGALIICLGRFLAYNVEGSLMSTWKPTKNLISDESQGMGTMVTKFKNISPFLR